MIYWFENITKQDIVLADLDCSIKKDGAVDLLKHNPVLTPERIEASCQHGSLSKHLLAKRIIRLEVPPTPKKQVPRYTISKEPIYSRKFSTHEVDPKEKYFVDELDREFGIADPLDERQQVSVNEKFLKNVNLDGFSDPLKDLDLEE